MTKQAQMAPRHIMDNVAEARLETGTAKRDVSPRAPRGSLTYAKDPAGSDGNHNSNREQLVPQALETHGMDFTGSFARNARPSIAVPIRPWYRRRSYFTDGWTEPYIWKAAVRATCSFSATYLSAQFGRTVASSSPSSSASSLGAGAVAGVWTAVMLSTLILATAPATGGHVNPIITWTTMLCGLCPVPRAVSYIIAQTAGAALECGFLVGSWGFEKAARYLSFGVGLDPRQAQMYGPALGPILVGLCFGMVNFVTTGTAPGYSGASMNPARCFGIAVASGDWSSEPLLPPPFFTDRQKR
ncbi:aquaporin-like protein [Apiospora phragmitis]|uniref:Aquaporin-like protein n=1 Tax=Apiospora phragmitis TaxID=2905665 RepID=A0ABR1WSK8_9PEZI